MNDIPPPTSVTPIQASPVRWVAAPSSLQTPQPGPYADAGGMPTAPPSEPHYSGPVKTDGFAITALVLGLLGGSLPALIFGLLALRRITRARGAKSGRGTAIAGIALGGIGLTLTVLGIAVALAGTADRDAAGRVVQAGSVDVLSLEVGDCLTQPVAAEGESEFTSSVQAVPCSQPHETQIVARFNLSGSAFPGDAQMADEADSRCTDLVSLHLNEAAEAYELELVYLHPTEETWNQLDDREVLCAVTSASPISESVLDESSD